MVERAKVSNTRYFIAFILTTGIFTLGLFLGIILTDAKLSEVEKLQLEFRNRLTNLEIEDLLIDDKICQFDDINILVDELSNIGETITAIEDDPHTKKDSIVALKEYYSLLEIRHMIFMQKFNHECGNNYDIILYFYSNDEDKCPDCASQGYILSYLRDKYDNVRVYSYDVDLNNPTIRTLMQINNVTEVPSLVINDVLYNKYSTREFKEKTIS